MGVRVCEPPTVILRGWAFSDTDGEGQHAMVVGGLEPAGVKAVAQQ